jgi:2-amino-4-hydroxy-6-hydroxymethyldihydropteridine diphosphokinase
MTLKYYLGLGSNIEPKLQHLKDALSSLEDYGSIIKKSSVYCTQPWGRTEQPEFYNAVIEYHTVLAPAELLHKIKIIENKIGRRPSYRWGPREIDIDIIFCDLIRVLKGGLQVPHKHFHRRRFVLEPMAELNKDLQLHENLISINDLLNKCDDKSQVKKLNINW